MHELALCQAIADTVDDHAGGRRATKVTVRIGHLRQVVPDSLQFSWHVLTEGTELETCELDVEYIPAVVVCRSCGAITTLEMPVLACATCSSVDVELRSGEEFLIVAIDVAQEVS